MAVGNVIDARLREIIVAAAKVGPEIDWCLHEEQRLRRIDRNIGLLSSTNDQDVTEALQYLGSLARKAQEQIQLMSYLSDNNFPKDLYEADFATFCGMAAVHVEQFLESPTHYKSAHETFKSLNAENIGNGEIKTFCNKADETPISRFGVILRNGELMKHVNLVDSDITSDKIVGLRYLEHFASYEIKNYAAETDPKLMDEFPLVCGVAIAKTSRLIETSDNLAPAKLLHQADKTLEGIKRLMAQGDQWNDHPSW